MPRLLLCLQLLPWTSYTNPSIKSPKMAPNFRHSSSSVSLCFPWISEDCMKFSVPWISQILHWFPLFHGVNWEIIQKHCATSAILTSYTIHLDFFHEIFPAPYSLDTVYLCGLIFWVVSQENDNSISFSVLNSSIYLFISTNKI